VPKGRQSAARDARVGEVVLHFPRIGFDVLVCPAGDAAPALRNQQKAFAHGRNSRRSTGISISAYRDRLMERPAIWTAMAHKDLI
jgi:hypothetical protein